jgi:hypothetical protein
MSETARNPYSGKTWAAFAILLGVYWTVHGYQSREGDQAYRLPLLLHRQDASLFADDPFVGAFRTFNPHVGYLSLLDWASRPLGLSAGLLIVSIATFFATAWGIGGLARSAWPGGGRRVGIVAMGLVLMARAGNIGTNHLYDTILLDRLIGFALGWLALDRLISGATRGRAVAASAALIGLTALVHPSVGLQLAMLLGASWIAWGLSTSRSGVGPGRAVVSLAVLGLALVPAVLLQGGQGRLLFEGLPTEEFRLLSAYVQSPQHMMPHLWRRPQWLAWGCYPLLTLLSLGDWRGRWTAERWRLTVVLGGNLLGLAVAWGMVEVVQDLRVTVFQPFRMATVFRGLAITILSGRVLALWERANGWGRARAVLLAVGLTGDWSLVVVTLFEITASLMEAVRSRVESGLVGSAVRTTTDGTVRTADPTGTVLRTGWFRGVSAPKVLPPPPPAGEGRGGGTSPRLASGRPPTQPSPARGEGKYNR